MADKVKRGKKLALQKHEVKQLKQLLFIKATLHGPPIALASDIVTSTDTKNNINNYYTSGGLPSR